MQIIYLFLDKCNREELLHKDCITYMTKLQITNNYKVRDLLTLGRNTIVQKIYSLHLSRVWQSYDTAIDNEICK